MSGVVSSVRADTAPDTSSEISLTEQKQIVEAYNRWAAGLRTLRAGGKARVGAEGVKTRAFNFSLVLARPAEARLQGRWGSLATLFDLSGNDSGWTLYLPQDRAVVRARDNTATAGLLLPPVEIISVLLPRGIPPRDLERHGAVSLDGGQVRLVVPPGKGGAGSRHHRVIWVDRQTGVPSRLEIRESTQLEEPILVAIYQEFEGKGKEAFPVEVHVDLTVDGQWAEFSFETIRINTEVEPKVFVASIPEGTRELDPEDLSPDFLPEEDGPGPEGRP
jgi:hypothetical protein